MGPGGGGWGGGPRGGWSNILSSQTTFLKIKKKSKIFEHKSILKRSIE